MPIKQNAKKALRQNKKRAEQNLVYKLAYKEAVKAVKKTAALGKDAKEMLRLAQKKMDKAAKVGVIKKNTAGRKLSRLTKMTKRVAK